MSTTNMFLLINLTGGIAVLASYFIGLRSSPDLAEGLWGGVTGNLRMFFTLSMLFAASGYLAFCYFFVFAGLGLALSDSGLALGSLSLVAILVLTIIVGIFTPDSLESSVKYISVVGLGWISFHCLVLDACIWVALFKHP